MAKKKVEKVEEVGTKADRHKPHKMLRVPLDVYEYLQAMAKLHTRPISSENAVIIVDAARKLGLVKPPNGTST